MKTLSTFVATLLSYNPQLNLAMACMHQANRIDIENSSGIVCESYAICEGKTLLIQFSGEYRCGSEGNADGLYMLSKTAGLYAAFEPINIILDLRSLSYTWGNTLIKTINYYDEFGRGPDECSKTMLIVSCGDSMDSLKNVDAILKSGVRRYFDNMEAAIGAAKVDADNYLSGSD